MTVTNKKANVLKYKKRKQINIGIIFFGVIFIYLIATIVLHITAPQITVYEVRQGSILKDNAYTGLAIREETVVCADESGYINYYAEDNSKVKVGTKIYTLSDEKIEFDEEITSESEQMLSSEEKHTLTLKIQSYNNQFQETDFSSTYQLKNEIQSSLNKITSQSKTEQLNRLLSSGTYSDLVIKTALKDGTIVYYTDGMEDVTLETISIEQLKKSNYKKNECFNNQKISSGEPIYKLVTNDNWKLVMEVSDDTKEALVEKKTVKVNFKKDNQEMRASISFLEQFDKPVLCLSFSNSMVRYINERYLDVELILEDETGLKIPKSSVTTKDFYVVSKSYITGGGDSNSAAVTIRRTDSKGNITEKIMNVTIYYQDEKDELVYLDPNVFEDGDILLKTDSVETYPLKETRSLQGVYCINKGYAVFKQIKILCESDEYYIIEEGSSFGLSNYDHIALDSISMKEDDVVF